MMDSVPILFQDGSLAVCEKPAGLLSEGEGPDCLPAILSRQLGCPIFPVHRLDRGTAGLMVFAKTPAAAAALSRVIGENRLEKGYLAMVSGRPDPPEGRMEDLLFKDGPTGKVFPVSRPRKGVREARLTYRLLGLLPESQGSLVAVRLETGRTHQIRAQFSARKMPLLGDGKYGSRVKGPLALFACRLTFPHPKTGETLDFFRLPDAGQAPWDKAADMLSRLGPGI